MPPQLAKKGLNAGGLQATLEGLKLDRCRCFPALGAGMAAGLSRSSRRASTWGQSVFLMCATYQHFTELLQQFYAFFFLF